MQRPPAPGPPGSQARPQGFPHPQGYGGHPGYGMYPPGQAPQYPPMHGPNMYMSNPGHPGMQGPAYGYPPHPAGGAPYYPGPMPPQTGYGLSHGPPVGQDPSVAGRPPAPVSGTHNVVPSGDGLSHPSSSVPPTQAVKAPPPSVNYRADEVEYYNNLFREADVEGFGRIQGREAVAFLSKSHLPKPTLKNIWDLADYNKQFFLTSAEFFVAMRFISLAQMGREMSLSAVESSTNMPLPKFENIRTPLPEKVPAVSQSTPASKSKTDIFDAFADLAPAVAEPKVELSTPVAPSSSTTAGMSGGPPGGVSHGADYQHHTGVLPNTVGSASGPTQQQFMYQQQQQQYQQQQQQYQQQHPQQHASPYHSSMAPSPPVLGSQQQPPHRSVTPPPARGPFAAYSSTPGPNPFQQQPSPSTGYSVSQPFAQMHQTPGGAPLQPQAHAVGSSTGFVDSSDDFGDFSSAVPTAPHIPNFATPAPTSSSPFPTTTTTTTSSGGAGYAMPMETQRFQTPPLKPMSSAASQSSPAVDFNSMMEMSFKGVAGQSLSPRTAPASAGTTTSVVPPLHLGAVSVSVDSTKTLSPAVSRETSPRALPKIAESGPVKKGYTSTPFESSSSARLDVGLSATESSHMAHAPKPSPTKPEAPLQDRMSAFDDLLEPEPVVPQQPAKFRAESDDFTDFQSSAPVPSQPSADVPNVSNSINNVNNASSIADARNRQVSFAGPATGMLSEPFAASFSSTSTDFKHRDSIEFDDFQGAATATPPTAPPVSVHSSSTVSTNSFNPFMSGSGLSSTYVANASSIMDDFDFGDPISAAPVVPTPAIGAAGNHHHPVVHAGDMNTRKMDGATVGGEAFNPFFQSSAAVPTSAPVSEVAASPPPPPPALSSSSLHSTDSFNAPSSMTQSFEEDDFGDFASASPSPDSSPRELPAHTVTPVMPEAKRELSAENAFSDFMSTSSSSQPKSPRIVPMVPNRSVSPKFTPAAAPPPPPPSVTLSDAMSAFDDLVESAPTPTITMPSFSFPSETRTAPPPPPPPSVNVSLAPFSSLAGQKPVFPTLTVSTSIDSVKSRATSSDEWDAFASALPVSSVPVSQSNSTHTGGAATSIPKPVSSPALSDFDFEFAAPMPSSHADSHGGSPTSPSDFDMMFSMSPAMPSTSATSISLPSPGLATKPSSVPLPAAAGDDMLFGDFSSSTPTQSPMGTGAAGPSVGSSTTDAINLFDLDIPPPAEFTRSNDYRYVSEQVLLKCEDELQQAVQHMTQVRNGHRDIRPKVMAHPKMAVFLQGIREVYRLSCRIFDTANKLSGTTLPPHLAQPASAQHWKSLKDLTAVCSSEAAKYLDIDVKNEPKMNATQGTDQICSLCLLGVVQPPPPPSMLTSLFKKDPVVVQDKSLAPVHLQGCLYHSSCINFWLHRVSMDPPNIKQHAAH